MNVTTALKQLNQSLAAHGLSDWTGGLDNARRRFGVCQPGKKHISLSRALCELNDEAEVRDTILHEIAHALAWKRHGGNCGHDNRWKAICVEIGARPIACYDNEVVQPTAPWVLVHRTTGEVFRSYFKRPRRDWSAVWIRGRKADTHGMLEIRSTNTANNLGRDAAHTATNETADMFANDDNAVSSTRQLERFTSESVREFRDKLIAHVNELATEYGLTVAKTKARYNDQSCDFTLTLQAPLPPGVDPQRLEFEAIASTFDLSAGDYMREFDFNGKRFRLVGFKPNNRKYPVIAIDERGQKYKFEPWVLDGFVGLD